MKIHHYPLALLCACLLYANAGAARTFDDPNLGFSISIDDSFSQFSREGDVYYFLRPDNSATIIIKDHPGLSREDLAEATRQGYQDEGLYLKVAGKANSKAIARGALMSVPVKGYIDEYEVKGLLGGVLGDEGQGLVILFAAIPDKWSQLKPMADKLFASLKVGKYSGGAEVAKWRKYLTGKQLAYRRTTDYSSRKEDFYLCSDGRFMKNIDHSMYSANVDASITVSGDFIKSNGGQWRIQRRDGEVQIIFNYDDGTERYAKLEDKDGKTLLGGSRYFVLENKRCD